MLKIYDVSLRMLSELRPFFEALGGRDRRLEEQARAAGTSVPLNIAEGSAFRNKRRRAHYEIALGSAKELRSVVDTAMALGYVAHVSEIGRDDLEHVIAVLINLSR